MNRSSVPVFLKAILAVFILAATPLHLNAQTRVSIGVTETMETQNPYGDSVALLYGIWCQVFGCLGTYDFTKGDYVGILAERWEAKDPDTWLFYLKPDGTTDRR